MDDENKPAMAETDGCGAQCGCRGHQINRREFLTLTGAAALTALTAGPVMAGPFEAPDFARLIPPDKKLRPEWLRSLFARGVPTVYTKKRGELRFIGMPVGGLCCGTVYLGGDGRLWVWDIFNENREGILPRSVPWNGFGGTRTISPRNGASYVSPHPEQSPLEQGFALKVNGVARPLDAAGWEDVSFQGEYPMGTVRYSDPACPVTVTLTAYSPFVPLDADDSGLPVVLCEFTLENHGEKPVRAEIAGWLQNAARLFSASSVGGRRFNDVRPVPDATVVECSFGDAPKRPAPKSDSKRPDITVEDFQRVDYGHWTVEGDAFGKGPIARADVPPYQGDMGGVGDRLVNSHSAAPGKTSAERDAATGTLTGPPFTVERRFLAFDIGGGADSENVGLALLVDGKTVRRAAGRDENKMRRASLDMAEFQGKQAVIQIYDRGKDGWGHIGVSRIVQTDRPAPDAPADGDAGTMALFLLGRGTTCAEAEPVAVFDAPASSSASAAAEAKLTAAITRSVALAPGQSQTIVFGIAWHFPNSKLKVKDADTGNAYARRFADAAAVAAHVVKNFPRLARQTRLWRDTWYDSTLPFWFLDRTFANTSILATSTAHRFGTGRFWGWEGVGCCEGTCTHVWHYAQAVGRLFPELERSVREKVDLGVALDPKTGKIGFRGEGTGPAIDGQCGRILGTYREHQMSADDAFLRRVWPNVRKATEFLMAHDSDGDGLVDGPQDNTLDGTWYGKIPWISSLYAAALRAGEEMAAEMGDADFAAACRRRFLTSQSAIETQLFDGEYFIQQPDPAHKDTLGAYRGCHIDQVQGQSWAWQLGLGRILDRTQTLSALRALYRYNFAPDVGPFRTQNTKGRPYALAGEAGLIMVTNPRGLPDPFGVRGWQFQYFNECMSGFEHQAASHMIAEGLVLEGLAVTRAIHDRYHASRRNPYNEVECSDHYSRAMASYGSYVSICGFEHHGPKGHIAFAPRVTPGDFRAAFTSAAGWGAFSQQITETSLEARVILKYGQLRLTTLTLSPPPSLARGRVTAALGSRHLAATHTVAPDGRLHIAFAAPLIVKAGQTLTVKMENVSS